MAGDVRRGVVGTSGAVAPQDHGLQLDDSIGAWELLGAEVDRDVRPDRPVHVPYAGLHACDGWSVCMRCDPALPWC